jgi:HK97 family phage prohead protease
MKERAEELLEEIRNRAESKYDLEIKASSVVKLTVDECKALCSKIGLEYKEGYENRVVQFRFTDATADRHNEVVIPSGVNLKSYQKDPVVLLQHDSFSFPIGKSLDTHYDPEYEDIVGKVLFLDDEVDRTGMSESTFRMVKAGVLKKGSIGFRARPEDVRMANPEERTKYKLDKFGIIFEKIELREFSIVTIPANPNAEQIAARKGFYTKNALETLKSKGVSNENISILSTSDLIIVDPPLQSSQIKIDTSAEKPYMKINIFGTDSKEAVSEKLKLADDSTAKGYKVEVFLDEREKVGAVLSSKNKEIIKNAISSITNLKTDLESLLAMAEPKPDKPEKSDDVHKDSSSDNLYNMLDDATKKLALK